MGVSVVIPLYNLSQYVGETISSILGQSFTDFEIIVVDDGSTDDSAAIVETFKDSRIKLIRLPKNGGITPAVNAGIRASTKEYICPLGADDLLEPWMMEKQAYFLRENPNIYAVFGLPIPIDSDGAELVCCDAIARPMNRSRSEWYCDLMQSNVLMGQTMLYRRSLHEELGMWDEKLTAGNDIDWFLRIVKNHDIYVQHIPMARIRMRFAESQLSSDTTKNRKKLTAETDYVRDKHDDGDTKQKLKYDGSVIISTEFNNRQGSNLYIKSLLQTTRFFERAGVKWDFIEAPKNEACARFLESEFTDLFLIDSSLSWSVLSLARMLVNPEEIVGGSIKTDDWSAKIFTDNGIPTGNAVDGFPLIKAEFITSSFMRIKKSALVKFRDKYQELKYKGDGEQMASDYELTSFFDRSRHESEDESFCRRWLEIGDIWVEPQIQFEVLAPVSIKSNLDRHYRDLTEQSRIAAAAAHKQE